MLFQNNDFNYHTQKILEKPVMTEGPEQAESSKKNRNGKFLIKVTELIQAETAARSWFESIVKADGVANWHCRHQRHIASVPKRRL